MTRLMYGMARDLGTHACQSKQTSWKCSLQVHQVQLLIQMSRFHCHIRMAWQPCFMEVKLPEAPRWTLHQLTEGYMMEQQRKHTAQLET